MKKNIFKKIVASLATVAMAAGLFTAMPAEEAKAATDYYLIGYIGGRDYGCGDSDWQNLGDYKFVDGTLTTKLPAGDNYVYVKTGDNSNWYNTSAYKDGDVDGDEVVLVKGGPEKMRVSGDIEYTFTIVENQDGTITLSYEKAATENSTQATENSTQATENSTQATENSTQATENSTQATENSTQATENSTQATQTTTKKEEATTAKKVDSVTVTVEWKDAPKGDVNIHAWGAASTAWPGQKMTANGDGTYTTTLKLTSEGKISFVVNVDGDANKTKDITDVDTSTGKIVIKVSKDAEGKLVGTANAVTTGNVSGGTGSAKPGDSAPIVMMFAVAAVAAGMVVASKKKTICE